MSSTIQQKAYWTDVAVAYQRAIRSFDEFVKPILKHFGHPNLGLTNILFLINIGDGTRRVADLVRQQRYAGSNASYALAALVDAGLIERSSDPQDRRVRVVCLTDMGRELLVAIQRVSEGEGAQIDAALATISTFENHIATLPG